MYSVRPTYHRQGSQESRKDIVTPSQVQILVQTGVRWDTDRIHHDQLCLDMDPHFLFTPPSPTTSTPVINTRSCPDLVSRPISVAPQASVVRESSASKPLTNGNEGRKPYMRETNASLFLKNSASFDTWAKKPFLVRQSSDLLNFENPMVPSQILRVAKDDSTLATTARINRCVATNPHVFQVLEFLFLGSIEAAYDEQLLCKLQIECIVDVSNIGEGQAPRNSIACTCPLETSHCRARLCIAVQNPLDLMPYFEDVNKFVEAARRSGRRVLVHGYRGISRGPAIVLQYLIQCRGMGFGDAYELVRSARSTIDIAPSLLKELRKMNSNQANYVGIAHRKEKRAFSARRPNAWC